MMLSYSLRRVDRQARSEHTPTSSSTESVGQALRVSLVKPGAYLSESYFIDLLVEALHNTLGCYRECSGERAPRWTHARP